MVHLLLLSSEEVFDFSSGQMTQTKTLVMKDTMCHEFSKVFQLCIFVLVRIIKDIPPCRDIIILWLRLSTSALSGILFVFNVVFGRVFFVVVVVVVVVFFFCFVCRRILRMFYLSRTL